ncbi:hypothetical protein [Streptomyces zagrosensis]|uniref:AG2 protein n=1 Tax=Streptomyces zagrosensis TaxID=1042984 RepID=A0A7W9Q6R1_9ACTN|nr:hypothetical protein [Streptomyces zagrosensis]MBB5934631.1 hypothetical protein [Streptomyces zagrosensis]
MGQLTFDGLYHVSLSSLGAAADDWKEMVDQLAKLATDAMDGMVKQSDGARWEGVNAGVTRPFIRTTGEEFSDAHTQARSVWSILRDSHKDLVQVQRALKKVVDVDAKSHEIRVAGRADGTVACVFARARGNEATPTPQQISYRNSLENQLNQLIAQADEIEGSAARALGKIHGSDSHNFGHAKYDSLDDAQRERTVQLAKKSLKLHQDGKELSTTELAEFGQLMTDNAKSPAFAIGLYRDMGAKDALRFEALMAINASLGDDKTRLKLAQSIQKNMGLALATATDPPTGKDNPLTSFREDRTYLGKAWIADLKKAGTQQLDLGLNRSDPVGYQALGSLLRHGTYDKSFLKPIAEDMIALERKGGDWPTPDPQNGDHDFGLNLTGKGGPGWDPMAGLMDAFARSPDASTAFFNGSTGGGDSGLKRLGNLEYFLGDDDGKHAREWPSDKAGGHDDPDDKSRVPGKEAFGHALESATSGRPYGDEGPIQAHTREQVKVYTDVINHFGGNTGLITTGGDLEAIAPSLGNMSAEYMYDIQRIMAGGDASGYFEQRGVRLDPQDCEEGYLKEFLQATAESPEAYGAITHAQQAVTTEAIRVAMAEPGEQDLGDVTQRAANPGGIIAGATAEGQANAIAAADDSVKKIEEYNEKLDDAAKWTSRLSEMAANHIPVAGDIYSWLAEDAQEAVFKYYHRDSEEAAQQIEENKDNYLDSQRELSAQAAKQAVFDAAKQQGISTEPGTPGAGAADDVYRAINSGYSDGKTR